MMCFMIKMDMMVTRKTTLNAGERIIRVSFFVVVMVIVDDCWVSVGLTSSLLFSLIYQRID